MTATRAGSCASSASFRQAPGTRSEIVALPPLQREALILAEYEDMPLQEIADVTGVELAAVKSRLHRGRQNLRRMLSSLLELKGTLYGTQK